MKIPNVVRILKSVGNFGRSLKLTVLPEGGGTCKREKPDRGFSGNIEWKRTKV